MTSASRGDVTLDGSLGRSGAVGSGTVGESTTTYLISSDLGQIRGGNLFHSFGTFNIDTGESATFTGPGGIENIIGRVTGGSASSIDGLIRSTIDGANLYLLNPSGIVFGYNASLDVQGSFHATTADYLKFADGQIFSANPLSSSVLSVAPPEAFGFLSATPGGITGNNPLLQVPEGQTLSLVGGDISFTGTPVTPDEILSMPSALTAPGGRINLVSVASAGEVNLAADDLGMGSFARLGTITFTEGAKLSVMPYDSSLAAGTIVIRGGQMLFQDGGMDVYGNPGGSVDIGGGTLHLDDYYVFAASFGDANHPGTAVKIDLSGDLLMTHAALIDTQTAPVDPNTSAVSGNGGDIVIRAADIKLGDDVLDDRSYNNIGYCGYIASATGGTGNTGDIDITTGNAVLQNGFFINTQTFYDGNAGDITLHADTLQLRDMGNIGVNAFGYYGNGGNVSISAREILISAANAPSVTQVNLITGIIGQTGYWSNGGTIDVTADTLRLVDGGQIGTVLYGSGEGADINLHAREVEVTGYVVDRGTYFLSAVDARLFGADATGTGGSITVTSDSLRVAQGGAIRTALDESASGQAGSITVNAGVLNLASRGQIYADSFRGTGDSGDIAITANSLNIIGAKGTPRPELIDFDFTGLSTTTSEGRGGAIAVTVSGDFSMGAQGGIKADTQGSGTGGSISVSARNLLLTDGASVNASSAGAGDAGDIRLTAGDSLWMRDASVTTDAAGNVDGGNIFVNVPNKLVLFGSEITSSVGSGEGGGGNITIDPEFVVLKESRIVANAWGGPGGNIQIVSDVFLADPGSVVDASSALGVDGTVDIQAPISNVSGLVGPLSADFTSATALLRERCIARIREGKYSSFVVGGRDGLPMEPGNLLPGLTF